MPTLLDKEGRLLLHLREAEDGRTAEELAVRSVEPVQEIIMAYRDAGLLVETGGRYTVHPSAQQQMDEWLRSELLALGREGRLYFTCAANMDPGLMQERVPPARFLCRAWLSDHLLAFPRRSPRWSGWTAGLQPSPGGTVWGVIYLVSEQDLAALDQYQGRAYVRQPREVFIQLSGVAEPVRVSAQVYIHVRDGSGGGRPSKAYMDRLRFGAALFALPDWYLDLLEGIDTAPDEIAPTSRRVARSDGRSKYLPLVEHLSNAAQSEVKLSFREVEQVLGTPLPPSATRHVPWWHPSPTHSWANLWADYGWKATPNLREGVVTFRRQWSEDSLFREAVRRFSPEQYALYKRVHDWAVSQGHCDYGAGTTGGFTFRLAGFQHSVFSAYLDGWIHIHFGWLLRSLSVERVELLRQRLQDLPGAVGMEEPIVPGIDRSARLPLSALEGDRGWDLFTAAITNL